MEGLTAINSKTEPLTYVPIIFLCERTMLISTTSSSSQQAIPRSAEQKSPSHGFLLCVEAPAIDHRQIGWQRCYMLPRKQSTSSTSTRAIFIEIRIYNLETEPRWFYSFDLKRVYIMSVKATNFFKYQSRDIEMEE
jgi:hypothetical protein